MREMMTCCHYIFHYILFSVLMPQPPLELCQRHSVFRLSARAWSYDTSF